MIKNIIGNLVEIEWGNPVSEEKFEGDDLWAMDTAGNVCSLNLMLTGKEETGSDFIKINDFSQGDVNSGCSLKFDPDLTNPESKRQYFFDDKILFDYRETATTFDLNNYSAKRISSCVTVYFNDVCDLEFLLLTGLHAFNFYPNSKKDEGIKLLDLELSLREQIWSFYSMSCLYQYDCSLNEYRKAVESGERLIKNKNLPFSIIEHIETNIEFWNEVIEDEYS